LRVGRRRLESKKNAGNPALIMVIYLRIDFHREARMASLIKKTAPKSGQIENPSYAQILDFGIESALIDIAEKYKIRKIIDKNLGKTSYTLSPGTAIIILSIKIAIGVVAKPVSFSISAENSLLAKIFPDSNQANLIDEAYWHSMPNIDQKTILNIENQIIKKISVDYDFSDAVGEYRELLTDSTPTLLDNNIQYDKFTIHIYYFCSIISLILSTILQLEFSELGYEMDVEDILKEFSSFKQIINYYLRKDGTIAKNYTFTQLSASVKKYFDKFKLGRYALL
jgi:hypothetical protein